MKNINIKDTTITVILFTTLSFLGIIISHFLKFNIYLYFFTILLTSFASIMIAYKFLLRESIPEKNALSFALIFLSGDVFFKSIRYFKELDSSLEGILTLSLLTTLACAIYALIKK